MKVLLLGKTGLLGSEFPPLLTEAEVEFVAPSHHELDVLDFAAVDQFLAQNYFDKILYCIAYTDVDGAETNQGLCEQLNVKALENILTHRRPIIHFSSEYVFDAPENFAIPEDYQRSPLNVYAQSKLQAEELLENSNVPFWNIRTSWLFGKGKPNFVTNILKRSLEQDEFEIVSDQVGRPTYVKDLAEYVMRNFILEPLAPGHYHVQNTGTPLSWADFAEHVLQKKDWEGSIKRISSSDLLRPALRPANSFLRNTKIKENMRDWREAVDEFVSEL